MRRHVLTAAVVMITGHGACVGSSTHSRRALLDWRCRNSTDEADASMRALAVYEAFRGSEHGDVCRIAQFGQQYFCPVGCSHVSKMPFCAATASVASGPLPCRHPQGQTGHNACTQAAEASPNAVLERHSASSSHGDVCRLETDDFYCPHGCVRAPHVPYCAAEKAITGHMTPCRVSVATPWTHDDKTSDRTTGSSLLRASRGLPDVLSAPLPSPPEGRTRAPLGAATVATDKVAMMVAALVAQQATAADKRDYAKLSTLQDEIDGLEGLAREAAARENEAAVKRYAASLHAKQEVAVAARDFARVAALQDLIDAASSRGAGGGGDGGSGAAADSRAAVLRRAQAEAAARGK